MNETDMQLVVEPLSLSEMINARVPKKGNKVEFKKNVEKSEGQKAVIQRYYAFDRCFDDFGNLQNCCPKWIPKIFHKTSCIHLIFSFSTCC
ncbi:kinesin-7, putative [Plasmodium ovale wallikeri]|uniref:Kinesin-7, putative n=1 Tax=Plasmodium ovale wallikeri TaxID=864142 RepID=A0A1A8ZMD3_PLAOA|nr:kinesin-7, putative [Plasmodium ovale wallikeri]SBT45047.1 kinesin-7, putative [Plasmodium ovale wallikeri]